MLKPRWILTLTLPLILVASIGSARAASIRDNAGLFDPDVVREAQRNWNGSSEIPGSPPPSRRSTRSRTNRSPRRPGNAPSDRAPRASTF